VFTGLHTRYGRMERVECTVCGRTVGRGPSGLGLKQHSKAHRREFKELTGRWPENYDEVRDFFAAEGRQPTLLEAATTDEQRALPDFRGEQR